MELSRLYDTSVRPFVHDYILPLNDVFDREVVIQNEQPSALRQVMGPHPL